MTPPPTTPDAARSIALGPNDRVCIIAGNGKLPLNVAEGIAALGHVPFILMLDGDADSKSGLARYPNETVGVSDFPRLPQIFRKQKITHVVLAGGVSRRPKWNEIPINLSLLRFLPGVLIGFARGDDGLLKILVRSIESLGIKVVGAHEIVPDLLARPGAMTRLAPKAGDRRDLDAALAAARAIGALDIGQAAVSIGGRVVALEGIEGTDGMLERVKGLRGHGRLAGKQRGVLVKCAKPGQELRADLPTIGLATIETAHAAGLAGIGVEAERSIVLDFAGMVRRADELGLFVVGLPRGDGA